MQALRSLCASMPATGARAAHTGAGRSMSQAMSWANDCHICGYVWPTLGSSISSASTPSHTLEVRDACTRKALPLSSRRLKPFRKWRFGRSSVPCMM
eukprot:11209286-Lingulodinium_polyedra.AAC.1